MHPVSRFDLVDLRESEPVAGMLGIAAIFPFVILWPSCHHRSSPSAHDR